MLDQPIFKENMLVFPWVYSPIAKLFASRFDLFPQFLSNAKTPLARNMGAFIRLSLYDHTQLTEYTIILYQWLIGSPFSGLLMVQVR